MWEQVTARESRGAVTGDVDLQRDHGGTSAAQADVSQRAVTVGVASRVVQPVIGPATGRDVTLGALLSGGRTAVRAGRRVSRAVAPAVRLVVDPPLVPRRLRLGPRLDAWGRLWQAEQAAIVTASVGAGADVIKRTVDTVLPLVDLTPLVEAVLARLDLDAVAATALQRIDLDPVAQSALDDLDLAQVLATALVEVDVTAIVVEKVDLGQVVTAALDQIDLTEIVSSRVDLERVVTAALDSLDLTRLVQERVDIAMIAEDVVDDIDLPEIIRASTGGIATEGVRSLRLHSVHGDEAVSRLSDRLLLRIRRRSVETDVELESEQPPEDDGAERGR